MYCIMCYYIMYHVTLTMLHYIYIYIYTYIHRERERDYHSLCQGPPPDICIQYGQFSD